jgi:periplasmic divalent cation tolerance protein
MGWAKPDLSGQGSRRLGNAHHCGGGACPALSKNRLDSLIGDPMKPADTYRLVLVTCANPIQAKLIARSVVEKRVAACVNILRSPIDSYYRWKDKVEKAREYILLIKTTERKLGGLEREVKRLHSYEVPEFIALPIVAGSKAYLDWLDENT